MKGIAWGFLPLGVGSVCALPLSVTGNNAGSGEPKLSVNGISLNQTVACGRRLDAFQAPNLLFVCDLAANPDHKLLQTGKDDWGYLHYKQGVPLANADAVLPGVHRYTACYGHKTHELESLLLPCDEKYRRCASCAAAMGVCYARPEKYQVKQFYASECLGSGSTSEKTMQISNTFAGRPSHHETAAMVTFVLDELNAPGSGKKTGLKIPTPQRKEVPASKAKASPESEKDGDASWWSGMFDEVGSLNAMATKSEKELEKEVKGEGGEKKGTGAGAGGSKGNKDAPKEDIDAGKSWWSSYLAEARGEKTLVPVPLPSTGGTKGNKKEPHGREDDLNKVAKKAHDGHQEKGAGVGSWFTTNIFDEEAEKKEKQVKEVKNKKKPSPAAGKESESASKNKDKSSPVKHGDGFWSGIFDEVQKPTRNGKALPPPGKKPNTPPAPSSTPAATSAAKGKASAPWYSGILAEKGAPGATPVAPKVAAPAARGNKKAAPPAEDASSAIKKPPTPWYSNIFAEEQSKVKKAPVPALLQKESAPGATKKTAPATTSAENKKEEESPAPKSWLGGLFAAKEPKKMANAKTPAKEQEAKKPAHATAWYWPGFLS
eukprot:g18460.t1